MNNANILKLTLTICLMMVALSFVTVHFRKAARPTPAAPTGVTGWVEIASEAAPEGSIAKAADSVEHVRSNGEWKKIKWTHGSFPEHYTIVTYTNRPYIMMEGGRCITYLFKFTDAEWDLITNHFSHWLVATGNMNFVSTNKPTPK